VISGRLFGAVASGSNLPDNFTISFWAKAAQDIGDDKYHKLFYGGIHDTSFALIYSGGGEFFLRRVAPQNNARYDYRFWKPAAFDIPDTQEHWYHIILVMGKRSDGMKYTKLYVGKKLPTGEKIKYDATGPRIVNDPDDVLAMDFGGGYAQFGQQNLFNSLANWGFGNADSDDPVYNTNITADITIDDFAVWDVALNENEAKTLFDCQRNNPANQCWSSSPALKIETPQQETKEPLTVFPNPASDEITVITTQVTEGRGYFELSGVEGKSFIVHEQDLKKGTNYVELKELKARGIKPGVYLLRMTTPANTETVKIQIK
jgi:hypothetical protein